MRGGLRVRRVAEGRQCLRSISSLTSLYSQLFWLLLMLALIYFGIGQAMLPKIQSTVDARDSRIADDLAAAEAARRDADETEEAYRARIDESRAEALKVTARGQAGERPGDRGAGAGGRCRDPQPGSRRPRRGSAQRGRARRWPSIENVAAEAAQDMVARLAGVSVSDGRRGPGSEGGMAHG